jgi:hypothetical protein
MKKLFGILLAAVIGVAVVLPEQKADAQVVYSRQCCDGNGVIRCYLVNWTPVGNSCFCPGQGWGYTC